MEASRISQWPGMRFARAARRRLHDDTHVMLAVAITVAAMLIELVARDPDVVWLFVAGLAYITLQITLGLRATPLSRPIPRLLVAIGFVSILGLVVGEVAARPMVSLYLPICAMAATYGRREAAIVGGAAVAAYAAPILVLDTSISPLIQRGASFLVTMVLLVIGTRRTVGALEAAIRRAKISRVRERRSARQMAGVEAVGRVLAAGWWTDALDELMTLLTDRFEYPYVSMYLLQNDGTVRLGAQRGYDTVIEAFDGSSGIIGRVMRTHESQLVRDVRLDPDYATSRADVRSKISVPLIEGGHLLGVLNVENARVAGLDESDRSTLILIAERLAAAIALGHEREAIVERASLFQALADMSRTINSSLEPLELHPLIVESVARVISSDLVVLTIRDPATDGYRVAAMHGGDQGYVGARIPIGEGMTGRAIAERRLVVEPRVRRDSFVATARGAAMNDLLTSAATPILADGVAVGAVAVARFDLAAPFTRLELEVLPIVAGHVSLAIANAELLAQVADAAIRDPLTGLFNRRHLDTALERLLAVRDRLDAGERRPAAAILFDLDHFGAVNKRHGHQVGDSVLRSFGAILHSRFRASDIVARFGGEEFLVVLDGANLEEATRAAEEIRREFEMTPVVLDDGAALRVTVSAGCSAVGPEVISAEALLRVADVALQMAKRAGRNQIVAA